MKTIDIVYNKNGLVSSSTYEEDEIYIAQNEDKSLEINAIFPSDLTGSVRAYVQFPGGGTVADCGEIRINKHTVSYYVPADYLAYNFLKVGFEVITAAAEIRFEPIRINVDEFVNISGKTSSQQGYTVSVQIGEVETLNPGESADVTNTGTQKDVVLNFGIPKGEPGYTPVKGTDYWTEDDKAEITAIFQPELEKKVDKVTGKGLSSNDFTDGQVKSINTLARKTYDVIITVSSEDEVATLEVDGVELEDKTTTYTASLKAIMSHIIKEIAGEDEYIYSNVNFLCNLAYADFDYVFKDMKVQDYGMAGTLFCQINSIADGDFNTLVVYDSCQRSYYLGEFSGINLNKIEPMYLDINPEITKKLDGIITEIHEVKIVGIQNTHDSGSTEDWTVTYTITVDGVVLEGTITTGYNDNETDKRLKWYNSIMNAIKNTKRFNGVYTENWLCKITEDMTGLEDYCLSHTNLLCNFQMCKYSGNEYAASLNIFDISDYRQFQYNDQWVKQNKDITLSKTSISRREVEDLTKSVILKSSTEGSSKRFKVTVDDSGTLSATEIA